MLRSLAAWRALLYLAAAVLSAVVSDWVIETGAVLGFYGPDFAAHDQRSALATATAGALLFVAAALALLIDRVAFRRNEPRADWLAAVARDISTRWSWRVFPSTLAIALVVRYAMESAELLHEGGRVATGVGWLGGPVPIALALHALFCAATILGLVVAMRAIARAFDAVVTVMAAVFAVFVPVNRHLPEFVHCDRYRPIGQQRSPLASHLGERAPPSSRFAAAFQRS